MTSKLKVVISTHPRYTLALKMLLESLDFQNHKDEIILAFNETNDIELYKTKYNTQNIVGTLSNNYEYSSFASIGIAIRDKNPIIEGVEWFFMIHDTTIAGPKFWKTFRDTYDIITLNELKEEIALNDNSECVSYSIIVGNKKRYLCNKSGVDFYEYEDNNLFRKSASWNISNGNRFESCVYPKRYIRSDMKSIMPFDMNNMQFLGEKRLESISYNTLIWRPLTNFFNIGFASPQLLKKCIIYDSMKLTKHIGIEMEVNMNPSEKYPGLKMLSGRNWSYFWKSELQMLNAIDIYGTNKPRSKALLPIIDLAKYVVKPYAGEYYHTHSP